MLKINSNLINNFLNNQENKNFESYNFIADKTNKIKSDIRNYLIKDYRELSDFNSEMIKKYYCEYLFINPIISKYLDTPNDITEHEMNSINNLLRNIICDLPTKLKHIIINIFYLEYYIKGKFYIKSERNEIYPSKPELYFEWMDLNYWNNIRIEQAYLPILINLGILKVINNMITSINKNDNNSNKLEDIVILLYGKLGSGKSSILCMLLGIFNKINGKKPDYHNISDNNRGTDNFEIIEIEFDNIRLKIIDIIGFGDPSKGYNYNTLWTKLVRYLDRNKLLDKIDIILYILDGSIPRLDTSEVNSLKILMKKMNYNEENLKEKNSNYQNLDYWKKVILICNKSNDIKSLENSKFGGLPQYKFGTWKKENNYEYTQDILEEYNSLYLDSIKEHMLEWKNLIESRKNEKLSYQKTGGGIDDQSFLVNFKRIAKNIYKDISDNKLNDLMVLITNNSLYCGTAERKEGKEDWDYTDCKINPLPDYDTAINNDLFFNDEYEIIKKSKDFIISENWLNDLINKIIKLSSSSEFKINFTKIEKNLIINNENQIKNLIINDENKIEINEIASKKIQSKGIFGTYCSIL